MSHQEEGTGNFSTSAAGADQELHLVRDALRGLRFGTVTIIVQDGVIVQIDRTEKRRIRRHDKQLDSLDGK